MLTAEDIPIYDLLNLSYPPVPARSRLYCLDPVGLGTPDVESQTGYIMRLAQAHSVTPAALFGWELIPLADKACLSKHAGKPNKSMILASSFRPHTRAMNGTGVIASDWSQAIEKATTRSDLHALTMRTWRNVVSHKNLIRQMRAWCPVCYEESRSSNQIVYEKLIWTLAAVKTCCVHRRKLSEQCQHCGYRLYHLASRSRPGYCSVCNGWLGVSGESSQPNGGGATDAELGWQLWAVERIGEILAAPTSLACPPSKDAIARSTSHCVKRTVGGSVLSFSRKFDIAKQTIGNWRRGESVPTLDALLKFCFHAGVSPLDFITGAWQGDGIGNRLRTVRSAIDLKSPAKRRWSPINLIEVERALRGAITEKPPPSMIYVARRLSLSSGGLRYRFPDLCQKIVFRHQQYQERLKGKEKKTVRKLVAAFLEDESRPSVADVARRVGWDLTRVLRGFPDLCRNLSKRYSEGLKRKWAEVGVVLREVLKEQPPPSMAEVVHRLGCSETSLYNYHTSLCRKIASRHGRYRKINYRENREQFRREVRSVALAVISDGAFPSVKRVEARIGIKRSLRSSRDALDVLREVRAEFGLDARAQNPTRFGP